MVLVLVAAIFQMNTILWLAGKAISVGLIALAMKYIDSRVCGGMGIPVAEAARWGHRALPGAAQSIALSP